MRFSIKPQKFLSRVRLPAQNLRRIGFGLELRSKTARSPLETGCKLAPRSDDFESSLKQHFAVLLSYYENDRFA